MKIDILRTPETIEGEKLTAHILSDEELEMVHGAGKEEPSITVINNQLNFENKVIAEIEEEIKKKKPYSY